MNSLRKGKIHNSRIQRWSHLTGLVFTLLALTGCASLDQKDQTEIYLRSKSFRNRSFDDVWLAAVRSTSEIDFIIRKEAKDIGFIYAVAEQNPDPSHLPPHMNVIIKEINGGIEVHCHIELPGQRDETGKRRAYANQFFKSLEKNL